MKTKFLTGTRSAWFELVVILESNRGCSWDWRRNKLSFSEIKIYTNFFLLRNIFLCVYITISSHLTGALCPCARFVAFIGAVISTGVSSSNFNRSCCVRFSPNPLVKVRIRFFSPYLISGLSCLLVWIQNWLGVGQIHFGMEMAVATTTVVRFWLYANGSLHTNIILQGALTKYPTLFFPDKTNPGVFGWKVTPPFLRTHENFRARPRLLRLEYWRALCACRFFVFTQDVQTHRAEILHDVFLKDWWYSSSNRSED